MAHIVFVMLAQCETTGMAQFIQLRDTNMAIFYIHWLSVLY